MLATFASTDDESCSPVDSAQRATGYDAHVDRLTALVVGYRNDDVYERDPNLGQARVRDGGEPIRLRSQSNRETNRLEE